MALFLGEYEAVIDAKHRLAINAGLRELIDPEQDGKDFILVLGHDRHLWLYPDAAYRRLLTETMKRSPVPGRQVRRLDLLFAMARLVKPDAQGRIVLPEKSMQRASVSDEVTLVGNFDHIEIWPRQEWEKHFAETFPTYGDVLTDASDRSVGEAKSE
jgi:MraZ protein